MALARYVDHTMGCNHRFPLRTKSPLSRHLPHAVYIEFAYAKYYDLRLSFIVA